jgi:hypothetical protein
MLVHMLSQHTVRPELPVEQAWRLLASIIFHVVPSSTSSWLHSTSARGCSGKGCELYVMSACGFSMRVASCKCDACAQLRLGRIEGHAR